MGSPERERDPVAPTANECADLRKLDRLFEDGGVNFVTVNVSGPEQQEIRLPPSAFRLLQRIVHSLAEDQAVSIVPIGKELTTQQAADLLNVSRPYLIQLLEKGDLPHSKTGTHRRIRFVDLMAYKAKRDAERRQALIELVRISEEMGLYEMDDEH